MAFATSGFRLVYLGVIFSEWFSASAAEIAVVRVLESAYAALKRSRADCHRKSLQGQELFLFRRNESTA
jgi:hypothetical protein